MTACPRNWKDEPAGRSPIFVAHLPMLRMTADGFVPDGKVITIFVGDVRGLPRSRSCDMQAKAAPAYRSRRVDCCGFRIL
jgi:hypothetical protein